MTPLPTGGELNPTQELYARTLGRERMDMLEHHVGKRAYYEPMFKARVEAATQSLTGSWPRGLVRASREVIGHVLHIDDVMTGRWQAEQRETDPLARLAATPKCLECSTTFASLDELYVHVAAEHRRA